MPLNRWRFAALMLLALSMGAAFSHLLQMPAKLQYDSALWLHLLQTLYGGYGAIAGACEIGAVAALLVLAFKLRAQRPALWWTLAALAAMALAHAAYWTWVEPVNAQLLPLTAQTLPPYWLRLRAQWEYTHAARAVLQIFAFAALVISTLPGKPPVR